MNALRALLVPRAMVRSNWFKVYVFLGLIIYNELKIPMYGPAQHSEIIFIVFLKNLKSSLSPFFSGLIIMGSACALKVPVN